MNKDVVGGIGLFTFSALYLWRTTHIPRSSLSDDVGPHGLPLALATLLALIAVFIFVRGWFGSIVNLDGREGAPLSRILGLLACGALYIVVAFLAGYVVATAITLFAVAVYEGAPINLRTIFISVCGAGMFWLVFVRLLNIPQPTGLAFGG